MSGIQEVRPLYARTNEFGARLKTLRGQRGLSLQALSTLIGFSRSHISNVEHEVRTATLDFAMACDRALQTDGELAALAAGATSTPRRSTTTLRPAQLPPTLGAFVGRKDLLAELDRVLERLAAGESIPAVCIHGPPGIGKTALAVWWAHRALTSFPDGVLFADLHGFTTRPWISDSTDVMYGFLRALGVIQDLPTDPDQVSALFRSALHGTRTLIVCDNATNAEQARQFLPGSPTCLLLVTSRDPMPSLAVRDGAVRIPVDRFSGEEALRLLGMVIGQERLATEHRAATELVKRCDYLPLAVRIAAERIATHQHLSLAQLAEHLAQRDDVLDVLATTDGTEAVRTVFSWSYGLLPAAAARLFRMLGLHPGTTVDSGAAAALAGATRHQVEPVLDALTKTYLVEKSGIHHYRLHDLVHAYAAERALTEPEAHRREAVCRLLHWYLHSAANAVRTLMPTGGHPVLETPPADCSPETFTSRSTAAMWCDRNLNNVVAATSLAKVFDRYVAEMLPIVLWDYYHRHKRPDSTTRGPGFTGRPLTGAGQPSRSAPAKLTGFDPQRRQWVTDLTDGDNSDNSHGVVPVPELDGELSVERSDLERTSTDFGRLAHRHPIAVLKPSTVEDIAAVVNFARSVDLPVVPRGGGYSTEGQSLVADGIVIDMSGFNTVHSVEPNGKTGRVDVDAGARWSDVLHATLPLGLTPPILTNYVEVSVAGTLSVGGISGASHHYGVQSDTVLDMEVVTPDGELRDCSATEDRTLFDAVRGGYGRHGIITRAGLALVAAPTLVRRYFLGYADLPTFIADQQQLALDGRFSYLEGQPQYDPGRGRWRFLLETAAYFDPPDEPDDATLLRGLRQTPGTEEISTSTFVEFAHRLAPSEALLRSLGTWEHQPHPWAVVLLPVDQTEVVVRETLNELMPEKIGTGGGVTLYPLRIDRLRTPKFPHTSGKVGFLFGLLRTAPQDDPVALSGMRAGNLKLHRRAAEVGGASLLPPEGQIVP